MDLVIIGDVHSRANALAQALADIEPQTQVVFIGDILDGRHWNKETTETQKTEEDLITLCLVLGAITNGAKLVAGNHDVNLLIKPAKTDARLKDKPLYQQFLKQVAKSETFLSLTSGLMTYHIAHANPFANTTKEAQVFGEKVDGSRLKWFLQPQTWPKNVVKVCGHYHSIIVENNLVVLDGDSKSEECLPVLFVNDGANILKKYYNE